MANIFVINDTNLNWLNFLASFAHFVAMMECLACGFDGEDEWKRVGLPKQFYVSQRVPSDTN